MVCVQFGMRTYINMSMSAKAPTVVCLKYGTCKFGNRSQYISHTGYNVHYYHLIRDSPYASPSVIDVITDPPCVANLTRPRPNILADAPLADIVMDISIDQV
jgi:hypothetical protein